jgi:hypothetical protein
MLGTVALKELVHRQAWLKLNAVHGHGASPSGDATIFGVHWLIS